MTDHSRYDDEDEHKANPKEGMHYEFECPDCNAHNPYGDGFKVGSEIVCFYCGTSFMVMQGEGRLRFKSI